MTRELIARPGLRRAAALSLLALVLLAGYAGAIVPVIEHGRERRESTEILRDALNRYLDAAHALPQLERRLASLEAAGHGRRGMLEADGETRAGINLQSRLTGAVSDAGGTLHSIEILRPDEAKPWPRIAVRTRLSIDLAGLQRLLHAVNETAPAMLLGSLDIARAQPGPRRRAAELDRLEVELTMFGYLARKT